MKLFKKKIKLIEPPNYIKKEMDAYWNGKNPAGVPVDDAMGTPTQFRKPAPKKAK